MFKSLKDEIKICSANDLYDLDFLPVDSYRPLSNQGSLPTSPLAENGCHKTNTIEHEDDTQ